MYATPAAFRQALEARVQSAAAERDLPISRVRQQVVFERYLARLSTVLGTRITIKGGVALELRLERARTTRDIDLRVVGRPDGLTEALRDASGLAANDFFSFSLEPDRKQPVIEGVQAVYEGRRYRVEARIAGKIYGDRFGLDVSFADVLTAEAEIWQGSDFLAFAGIERASYRLYPREAHIAEKLHAYTLPRSRENTRIKDLPDIALLATTGPFDAVQLRRAIDATFAFRATHVLPPSLPAAPDSWALPYERMAARDRLPWPSVGDATSAAKRFLDPVLRADLSTVTSWDAGEWDWKPPQQTLRRARSIKR